MCGIAGIYRPGGLVQPRAAEASVREACRRLAHRGPDAEGVKLLPKEGVILGHRRLAILDLDPRANQPMSLSDGSAWVAYNGEIYNFRELREELRRLGASFRTESDTEVLLEGYRAWGLDGVLDRAAGMFAFALYDGASRRFFLARDRAGKKPLFYAERDGGLAFASEAGALLAMAPECRELDPQGLDAYLNLKLTPSPGTLFAGMRQLPPAHYLEAGPGEAPRTRRYWHPYNRPVERPAAGSEWLDRVEASLETAVRRRLVSDVPVCLFLSGGTDSGLLAAMTARAGAELTAYTIGYRDLPDYNEFEPARLTASRYPVRHREIVLESSEAIRLLKDDSLVGDEPISDWVWVPLEELSRRAREDGFKVVLVGEGSDELFFGYDVMLKGLRNLNRFENPAARALAWAGAAALKPIYQRARKGHRRYDLLRRVASGEPVYLGSSIGFGRSQRHQVAGPRLLDDGDPASGGEFVASLYRDYRAAADPRDRANLVCYVEFFTKMSEVLLKRVDRVTMRHSLEARCPFLDHELAELAFAMPEEVKIPQRRLKGLLKELARRHLPAEVVDRPKTGFSFPFKEWLRGSLGGLVEDRFRDSRLFRDGWLNPRFALSLVREHRRGHFDHAPRVWALFALCRWYDRWIARG